MEIGYIVILCFGLVFVLIGFFMMRAFQKGNNTGEDVEATVLSTRKFGRHQGASYYATLQYEVNGQTYATEISTNTIHQPEEGSTLIVGIDPYEPEKVHLRRGKSYIVYYILGGTIAGVAVLLSLL